MSEEPRFIPTPNEFLPPKRAEGWYEPDPTRRVILMAWEAVEAWSALNEAKLAYDGPPTEEPFAVIMDEIDRRLALLFYNLNDASISEHPAINPDDIVTG